MQQHFERLVEARINLLPAAAITTHFVFERDGYVALVERLNNDRFGKIGSAGLLTENGFTTLLWRGAEGIFVGKGIELPATGQQVEALREFQRDLEACLG